MIINYKDKPCVVLRKWHGVIFKENHLYEILSINKRIRLKYVNGIFYREAFEYSDLRESKHEIEMLWGWKEF